MAFPILTAEEVAELVHDGDTVCVSGFTAAGSPKAVTEAIAHKAEKEHAEGKPFKINLYSGASTNNHADGALARANALNHRSPYQNTPDLRTTINSRDTNYFDLHLSELAQKFRYGALGGIDLFIIEAASIRDNGDIVLGNGVGNVPTYAKMAKKVVIELNSHVTPHIEGLHDLSSSHN